MNKDPDEDRREDPAALLRPTDPQRRYLERGLSQPGGKLPLFYADGREVAPRTIQTCVAHGWAEPWFSNPLKPEWLVCRLTGKGRKALADTALADKALADKALGETGPPESPRGMGQAGPKRRRSQDR